MATVADKKQDELLLSTDAGAWYVSGANVGERCENLLASNEWQTSNPRSYKGLVNRLLLMTKSGLPKMRVLPIKTIEKLGRIPRSHEGYAVDALDEVVKAGYDGGNFPKAIIVFFSHRWSRPNWCGVLDKDVLWGSEERKAAEAAGHIVGDIDDKDHTKASSLVEWTKWFKASTRTDLYAGDLTQSGQLEILFWIDWPCVNQLNPGPDMGALPAFVSISHVIACYWNDEYASRAWCQVELMMANAFCTRGLEPLVVPAKFNSADYIDNRKNVAYSCIESTLQDPLTGNLTNENDMAIIRGLRYVAASSKTFTCYRNFVNTMTSSVLLCLIHSFCTCCQCFFCLPLIFKRNVQPGKATINRIIPKQIKS